MYGGSGRPDYSSLGDWWKVITGVEDKVSSKFDNETFFGYEISFNMPFLKKPTRNAIKGGRLYQDRASPDATAPINFGPLVFTSKKTMVSTLREWRRSMNSDLI